MNPSVVTQTNLEGIAIIGMSGRFPGAKNVDQFWRNLVNGVESISRFREDELEFSVATETAKAQGQKFIRARAVLDDVDMFDAAFFGIYPREAEVMDPQHRFFLECAWESLESAGYDPEAYPGLIGVYAGLSLNTYLLYNLSGDGSFSANLAGNYQVGEYQTMLGNDKDFLPTRVSYKLNLKGPSMAIQTACSTSLVAVCQACTALLNYQCDMAISGGVSISFPQKRDYLYQEEGMVSGDGSCRTFDASAHGTVFGHGTAVVLLKRLADAVADGDNILAVIKGAAVNNDGSMKIGYAAPSVNAQADVIAMAQAAAGIAPETVSYIEAHGTGTPLGDPIEVAALTRAFRNGGATGNGFCAIGTCKTNISHLDVAAGATGLIKTVLQFQHGQIPPLLHFKSPNPKIDFANSPFYPVTKLLDWKRGETPRRAGVSAFGVGGTNAHVVVEEAPPVEAGAPERGPHLIVLSAKTETALDAMSRNLAAHLEQNPGINLADVSFTLQMGRRPFEHRRMLFALNTADAIAMLRSSDAARAFSSYVTPSPAAPATGGETAAELAQRWLRGETVDWSPLHTGKKRRRLPLPTYPFERKRFWIEPPKHRPVATTACHSERSEESLISSPARNDEQVCESCSPVAVQADSVPAVPRKETLVAELKKILTEMSGQDLSGVDASASFFDLGFDSLFLTQVGLTFRNKFGVKITFRQLLENLSSIAAVADYLDAQLPPDKFAAKPPAAPATPVPAVATAGAPGDRPAPSGSVLEQMSSQLAEMMRQLEALRSGGVPTRAPATKPEPALPKLELEPKRFGPYKPIDKSSAAVGFTAQQQKHLDALIARYVAKTPRSKELTQRHRAQFADPRAVAGFRPFWKEMVYPIVAERSLGSQLWDIDGNEYVDVTMGFGTNLLGHSPPFVTEAVAAQLQRGVEVGPSSKIAGEVAALFCELTGNERVTFCNTGSEATLCAARLARTVSGRAKIATMSEAYHGICDEFLVRDAGGRTMPIAPGIPQHAISETLVLDWGSPAALDVLKQHIHELAAVFIETVQSRRPEVQPVEFIREVRRITREAGVALVLDEVITGFRAHPGGIQALWDIRADMACYGKVIGGGMPIGALGGRAEYMDALDGGMWQYGDASFPEVGVTFFAGTYVRHPLAMAAARAVLTHLKNEGPRLQAELTERAAAVVDELNAFFTENHVPATVTRFASMIYFTYGAEFKYPSLLFFHLREKGLHIWEGRPWFLSTAHSEEDIAFILRTFKESVREMQAGGFLPDAREAAARPEEPVGRFCETPGQDAGGALAQASQTEASYQEASHRGALQVERTAAPAAARDIQFSLYFFGAVEAERAGEKYALISHVTKFGDEHGFSAVWLPERHFHQVGGFSPNPSVLAAALARETSRIHLRGGSVVLPLHHPVRIAEEWSVVDNLSNGRAGISIASGWHPNDFVFAPEAFEKRRELCSTNVELINRLWRGETVSFRAGAGNDFGVKLHPMPKQKTLPIWLTCIHSESYAKAGEMGVNVLGYLMNQTVDELAGKIRIYRESLAKHGRDPASGHVTVLLHTFVGENFEQTRDKARGPLREYLRSYLDNSQKRLQSEFGSASVEQEDIEFLLDRAFEDYVQGKALIGTPESCAAVVDRLRGIGVDEIGCFVDFGVESDAVIASLPQLYELRKKYETGGDQSFPLVESQMGLLMIAEMDATASRAYNEANTLELRGTLNLPALQKALRTLTARHEALRTRIDPGGESQTVLPDMALDFVFEDCSSAPEKVTQTLNEAEARLFDLHNGPFFRSVVLKVSDQRHLLLLVFHHAVSNGPSYWVFMEELVAVYAVECRGEKPELERAMQPREYVRWRRGLDQREAAAYWLAEFKEPPPVLELPADHPRPQMLTYCGARQMITLDADFCRKLRHAGAEQRCSLFMMLFTAFNVLLHRLSGQDDVVVGVSFESSVRELEGGKTLFANTTNVLPMRSRIGDDPRFGDYLRSAKSRVLEAAGHQEYFIGRLIKEIKLPRDPARSPLFSVLFNFESSEFHKKLEDLEIELLTQNCPYRGPAGTAMYELYLNVAEKNGALELQCDHNTDLFAPETVLRWLGHYRTLLEAIVSNPDRAVHEIPLLDDAERRRILVEWNDTRANYPEGACLHALIEAQVERTPDAVALVFKNERLTYRELNSRANKLARELQGLGVGAESLVAICLERSIEMVVGLLGILKAGGAYVPLDPEYPRERLAFMLADVNPAVLLTQSHWLPDLPHQSLHVICLDQFEGAIDKNPVCDVKPENPAYVIYTSGSTGQPKGAVNTHRGICNRLLWMQETYKLTAEDRVLLKTPFTFDVSVWEFFWPLLTGARLIVAQPGGHSDSAYLIDTICREAITTLHFVPPMLSAFLEDKNAGRCASLKRVICSGEALPAETQRRFFETFAKTELHNLYGPTEAAVDVTAWACKRGDTATIVPIGRPVANTQIHILDKAMQPVPAGVAGELHIGGVQLARGYLARPELTAEKFVPNPFGEGRLYKTGDLARYRGDSTIEFLGRIDHQVKVRGFRIELGEIELALARHPAVRQCVVVAREDRPGDKRLAAYIVRQGTITDADLRAFLKEKLPDYMVPSAFVSLDALPLNANGKLDRKALPAPVHAASGQGTEVAVQGNSLERKVAEIWARVLGVGSVGLHDNFFELGGDSLLGLRIVNQLRELLGEHVSLVVIFEAPTVAALTALLEKNYAEAVARTGGTAKSGGESQDKINAAKVAQMRQLIGTVPPAIPPNGAGKNSRAIFILSPMRSGSTLFRIMLAGHPALFAPPELQLLAFNTLAERAAACEGYEKYMLEGTIRAVMEIKGCDMEQAQAEMQKMERAGWSIRKFYRQMQDWIAPRILVDKTPDYAMDIEILRRAELDFENAFYLHLTRHPLGMIRSYEKGRFILESPYRHRHNFSAREMAELTWLVAHENILQFLASVPRERQHRVKFEDLVENPQPALEGVCQAIGLEFHPAMLQPYADGKKKMTDGIHPLSQQVGDHNFQKHQGVRAEVAKSWCEEYSSDFLGEITWQVAKSLGYENPFASEGARPDNSAPIKPVSREARRVKQTAV